MFSSFSFGQLGDYLRIILFFKIYKKYLHLDMFCKVKVNNYLC